MTASPVLLLLFAQYPGVNGFLGTRGSLMLDLVFVAMFAVVPVMIWSICQVKFKRRFQLHKTVQIVLATVLLVAVLAFEIDMRITGWRDRASPSPFWKPEQWDWIDYSLLIHLFFAIPTAFVWVFVMWQAMRRFPTPPAPNQHSRGHIFWARLAAFEMFMTALTGWVFYWLSFVAS